MSFEWKDWQYATLFIPLALGAISVLYWKLSKGNKSSEKGLFLTKGIIWVFLYILLGLSWSLAISYYNSLDKNKDIEFISPDIILNGVYVLYAILILVLAWWPHFSADTKNWQTTTLILAFMCLSINPMISNLCLAPLIAWIIIRPTYA